MPNKKSGLKKNKNLEQVDRLVSNSNFETSPLRFEMEILLQEFRDLRAEILLRLSNEQQILSYIITLIVASVTIIQFEPQITNITGSDTGIRVILLVTSILFAALGLMYVEQDIYMATIGQYIEQAIKPQLNKIVQNASAEQHFVLEWDKFKTKHAFKPPMVYIFAFLSSARYALPIFPPIILLTYYFFHRLSSTISSGENLLFGFSICIVVATIIAAVIDGFTYLGINKDPATSNETPPFKAHMINRAITKRYYVPVLTVLLGIVPMAALSLSSSTLWFDSKVEFPLFSIPTIFIGDTFLLPWFNYKAFELFAQSKFDHKIKTLTLRIIILSTVSYLLNLYTHSMWVSDSHLGFMDTELGKLSSAGIWHFWFSVFQIVIVLLFLWISFDFYKQKNTAALIDARKTWFIILIFSQLTIFDFIVKHILIFHSENIVQQIVHEINSFSTLFISVSLYLIYGIAIKKLKTNLTSKPQKS